eukprot:TRINITY_DN3896_c2_g1_i1.p1 TRINITY_DN3896_c2_g1~~TRINITY_DN3896_c2_g1_i1.p1  ORF type:complete len:120 (-),score=0.29 TRINITY_DN3896_c2_g1_i1:43-402(-)
MWFAYKAFFLPFLRGRRQRGTNHLCDFLFLWNGLLSTTLRLKGQKNKTILYLDSARDYSQWIQLIPEREKAEQSLVGIDFRESKAHMGLTSKITENGTRHTLIHCIKYSPPHRIILAPR